METKRTTGASICGDAMHLNGIDAERRGSPTITKDSAFSLGSM